MASFDKDLALHLALDEIQNDRAPDESANDNAGAVGGNPRLVPDELFGSCFDFDGTDDYVEVKDPFVGGKDFTIAVWLKPAGLDNQWGGPLGFGDVGKRKPSLWGAGRGGELQYDSYDAKSQQYGGVLANFFTRAGEWVHVAWVKEGTQYRFYRGGQLFATHAAPEELARDDKPGYFVGRADSFWRGQLAHARVYTRALTAEEIQSVMHDDQTATAAFRKSHPVEFSVYDDDQQPVLIIDDGGAGHPLNVEIANSSQLSIELAPPVSPTPSPDNYHFALRFRPGALSDAALAAVGPDVEARGWKTHSERRADGLVSLYFLNPAPQKDISAGPGQSIVLRLTEVSAGAAGGSRGTRVQLSYSQLRYVGETALLSGSRVQHLEIISQRGKRNVPLHVGFLGSNRVLNDGETRNDLRLRITNTLANDSIPLNPYTSTEPTTFTLSFDVQGDGGHREWALGTADELQHADVRVVRHIKGNHGGSLMLHLPLAKVENGTTPDVAGKGQQTGTVKGSPSPQPDQSLGAGLHFDGATDCVEVADPFGNKGTFTIAIWALPDAVADDTYHGMIGYEEGSGLASRKPGLMLGLDGSTLMYDTYDNTQTRVTHYLPDFFVRADEWVHIAWAYDGAESRFYRNGKKVHSSADNPWLSPPDGQGKYWVGRVGTFWKGRLAHARVYSRALSEEDIQAVMLVDQQQDETDDPDWKREPAGVGGQAPEWRLTTTKTALAPGEIIQVKLDNILSSLPSGQTNLYVHYKNLPGYWPGQFAVAAEKMPLVTRGQRVGIGVNHPRSELDTGLGVMTGAAADYQRAQATLSGGGKVTWTADGAGGRLKWTNRFIAISMGGYKESFKEGHVNINQPASNIPAANVWDGKARSVNESGVLLKDWEALYAVHRVGGARYEVEFRLVNYTSLFTAPSNWLLVAARNGDDKTVKLGNGVILSPNSSSTNGSPVMSGTIIMWSGDERNIPDGWVLCDGQKLPDGGGNAPDLTGRFVVGAGQSAVNDKPTTYKPNETGGQERVTLTTDELPVHAHGGNTTPNGGHRHSIYVDSGGDGQLGIGLWVKGERQTTKANWRSHTDEVGDHMHSFITNASGGDASHDNMPPYWALCLLMKL
jgi:microcystin-dependent protein